MEGKSLREIFRENGSPVDSKPSPADRPYGQRGKKRDNFHAWERKHPELAQFLVGEFMPEYGSSDLLETLQRLVRERIAPTEDQTAAGIGAMLEWRRHLVRKPDPDARPHWVPEEDAQIWELAKLFRRIERDCLDYSHSLPNIYVKLEPRARDFRSWFNQNFPEKGRRMKIAHGKRLPEKKRFGWKYADDWADVFRHVITYYFWEVPYGSVLSLDDFCEKKVFSDTLVALRQLGQSRYSDQKRAEAPQPEEDD